MQKKKIQLFIKRFIDIAASLSALILLFPLLAVVAAMVRCKLGGPVIFRQQRPGYQGRPFVMFKFRTMADLRDENGQLLPDSERLLPFGRFLRNTSLDELPELFNVLKGQMSLVGPRPLMMKYLSRYTPRQARRHEVKPGITGWAQINGRNALSWEEKFEMDIWYVENWNLWVDLKILIKSIIYVFAAKDVNQPGTATVDEFMGTDKPPITS